MMKQWGGRFERAPSASAEAFGASLPFDVRLYAEDVLGSLAHCRMLAHRRIVSLERAQRVAAGLGEVYAELQAGAVDLDPAWEDVHTLVEGRLAARVGEDAGRLHTARSRNDQVALDLR